jgi:hypothetical protein
MPDIQLDEQIGYANVQVYGQATCETLITKQLKEDPIPLLAKTSFFHTSEAGAAN